MRKKVPKLVHSSLPTEVVVTDKRDTLLKTKPTNIKQYEKLKSDSPQDKKNEIYEKVKNNELKWAYFSIEGNIDCHYYIKK
jgi:hypothetical protein